MGNRCGMEVDSHDVGGRLAQQRTAVTLAAGDVKNATSGNVPLREKISMPVFVRDLAFGTRHKTFTGELEGNSHRVGRRPPPRFRRRGFKLTNFIGSPALIPLAAISVDGHATLPTH